MSQVLVSGIPSFIFSLYSSIISLGLLRTAPGPMASAGVAHCSSGGVGGPMIVVRVAPGPSAAAVDHRGASVPPGPAGLLGPAGHRSYYRLGSVSCVPRASV